MFKEAGERHERAVHEDDGESIERIAQSDVLRLVVLVKLYHVEAVGRDVVCGTGERHCEEEEHRALKPERRRQREGDASQRTAHEQLHREHPPAFCLQQVDERTP